MSGNRSPPVRVGTKTRADESQSWRDFSRVDLPALSPGKDVQVKVPLPASGQLLVDLVEEGVTWFGSHSSESTLVVSLAK